MKRKKKAAPDLHRKFYVAIRVNGPEYDLVKKAAAPYPPATWSRIELLRLARKTIAERKPDD